ncbi:MAG TPA: 6-phosphofructokinase, partial [Candidatus Krumholzibacterium sp.]|nr:6-phosphofructokinase [Candidatus Krumholzibacterium sp.]
MTKKVLKKSAGKARMPDPGKIKKIGILTGGGDCPGLNAVIKGLVRNADHKYGWQVEGIEDGFDGLLDCRSFRLTPREMSGLQLRGGTILGTSNRGNPLKYPMKVKGKHIFKDVTGDIVANIRKMGIDALVAV